MAKKLLSILLAIAMVLTVAPVSVFAEDEEVANGTCGDDLTWVLYDDGELVISGTGAMDYADPFEDGRWFYYKELIKFATINEGVTSIPDHAFYNCMNLEGITILQV